MDAFILPELGETPRRVWALPCVRRSHCASPPTVSTCSLGTVGCATELEAAGNPSFICFPSAFIPLCVSASSLSSLELTIPFLLYQCSASPFSSLSCVCVRAQERAVRCHALQCFVFFFNKDTQRKKRARTPRSVARLLPVADVVQTEVVPAGAGLPAWAFLPAA